MGHHNFSQNREGQWIINCNERKQSFSHKLACFVEFGICPYCKDDARKELRERKEEMEKFRLNKAKAQELTEKNCLTGWLK